MKPKKHNKHALRGEVNASLENAGDLVSFAITRIHDLRDNGWDIKEKHVQLGLKWLEDKLETLSGMLTYPPSPKTEANRAESPLTTSGDEQNKFLPSLRS